MVDSVTRKPFFCFQTYPYQEEHDGDLYQDADNGCQ